MQTSENKISREDFMRFFRNDDCLATLSADDRIELFLQALTGESDITVTLLSKLLSDYEVSNIIVKPVKND
jgi:hypothetical protein